MRPLKNPCLERLGCYSLGKADKLAEIHAAVVLVSESPPVSASLRGDPAASREWLGSDRP